MTSDLATRATGDRGATRAARSGPPRGPREETDRTIYCASHAPISDRTHTSHTLLTYDKSVQTVHTHMRNCNSNQRRISCSYESTSRTGRRVTAVLDSFVQPSRFRRRQGRPVAEAVLLRRASRSESASYAFRRPPWSRNEPRCSPASRARSAPRPALDRSRQDASCPLESPANDTRRPAMRTKHR